MMIFPRFGKCLVGNATFSALINKLLQKAQILTNNFLIKNIFLFTFISIYFCFTVNLDIKNIAVIKAFLILLNTVSTFL